MFLIGRAARGLINFVSTNQKHYPDDISSDMLSYAVFWGGGGDHMHM